MRILVSISLCSLGCMRFAHVLQADLQVLSALVRMKLGVPLIGLVMAAASKPLKAGCWSHAFSKQKHLLFGIFVDAVRRSGT
jgi:hypothetical protein